MHERPSRIKRNASLYREPISPGLWSDLKAEKLIRDDAPVPAMIVALHTVLRTGCEESYDTVHERIPADLLAAHRRVGIRDWRIWRSGRDLFHLVECDDFDAAMGELVGDPANEEWQAFIGDYLDRSEATPLRLVWRMRDQ